VYSYLLLLWPRLLEEIGNGTGEVLGSLETRFSRPPGSLARELRPLLSSTSSAEAFACEASRLLVP
jgi:hypothetical protein